MTKVGEIWQLGVSIHALLAESDRIHDRLMGGPAKFLSTLSLRRATRLLLSTNQQTQNFYPRSPCGERHKQFLLEWWIYQFLSTLSLRRATPWLARLASRPNFYPRSPCGERLSVFFSCWLLAYFYPRSPCGERHPSAILFNGRAYFYPRSPCGERHYGWSWYDDFTEFLSTLSLRRATDPKKV